MLFLVLVIKKQLISHAILQVDLFLIVTKFTNLTISKCTIQWHVVYSQYCATTLNVLKC